MDTEKYCKTLDNLDKTRAIRAIHEAYLQLKAISKGESLAQFDNKCAINSLRKNLEDAGHIGFI